MSKLLLFSLLPFSLWGQSTLYTCMSSTKDYVVGATLPMSGLFAKQGTGPWQHAGFNHPLIFGLDVDPADSTILYLAAGNGLFRAAERGQKWKLLTGSDVTELRDVTVDKEGAIYFAHSHGIRMSHDKGLTWQEIGGRLHRKYTETLLVDRVRPGVLLAGGEEGIFRTEDEGQSWKMAGAAGFQISRLAQSPHDACHWLAVTQQGGVFVSQDCGKTFENLAGRLGVNANLYDVAFDPRNAQRIAVVGWGPGVAISEDSGKTWQLRNHGLPVPHVLAVAFDPSSAGRLFISVNDEAVYVSNDVGKSWTRDGLEGSAAMRLRFVK